MQRLISGPEDPTPTPEITPTPRPSCDGAIWWYEARGHGKDAKAEEIEAHEEAIRRGDYAALLQDRAEGEQPAVVCSPGADCFDTRTAPVREGAPVTRMSLAELSLPDYGIELREARRHGELIEDVPVDFVPWAGDELVLVGQPDAFARVASLFRADDGGPTKVIRSSARARANEINCFCPTESPAPRSRTSDL